MFSDERGDERRRTVVSWAGAEGCEALTMTIPIPIAVSWKGQENESVIPKKREI